MPTDRNALPDDVETLKRLVIGRDEMIAKLMVEIARLKRWRFGQSAERVDATLVQLQLLLDDLQAPTEQAICDPETVPLEESTQAPPRKPATQLRRVPRALPAHLPRETIVHAPASCSCPDCGAAMRKLGEDIAEMLDFIPGYFKVLRHVRPKFSCSHCARVIQLPAPSRPIDRGLPTPSLLAQVITAKYADHCPLARPGFDRLVAWLCAGEVGAVLCFDASRLDPQKPRASAEVLRAKSDGWMVRDVLSIRKPLGSPIFLAPAERDSEPPRFPLFPQCRGHGWSGVEGQVGGCDRTSPRVAGYHPAQFRRST